MYAVHNNIFQNLLNFREDVGMAEDIYGHSVPNLKGKTVQDKIWHVEPVMVTSVPKDIHE